LPLDVKFLAGLFILVGILLVLDYASRLLDGQEVIAIKLVFGVARLIAGVGLLRRIRLLRLVALVLVWLELALGALFFSYWLSESRDPTDMWLAAFVLLPLWELWVLVRPRTRVVFDLSVPIRPLITTVKTLAVVAALFVGIPLLVNLPDEELREDVHEYLDQPVAKVVDERNALYALFGFRTGRGDMHSAGLELWRRYQHDVEDYRLGKRGRPRDEDYVPQDVLTFAGDAKKLCRPAEQAHRMRDFQSHCLAAYRRERVGLDVLIAHNREWLARYLALHEFTEFFEPPYVVDSYPLRWQPLFDAHYLFLTQLARRHAAGETRAAVTSLARDLRLWRALLAGSCYLATKMAATRMLTSDFALLLELLQETDDPGLARESLSLLKPLTAQELDLSCPVRTEFHLAQDAVQRASNVAELWDQKPVRWYHHIVMSFGFKRNATVNRLYDENEIWRQLARAPAAKIAREYRAWREAPLGLSWKWSHVYNPLGKLYVEIARPDWALYFQRPHDAETLRRLVYWQARIIQRGVTARELPALLAQSPPELHDPYTAKPFRWEPGTSKLYSEGFVQRETKTQKTSVAVILRFRR
jgi:hypothetical protein